MGFLWTGSQIPLYLFGAIPPIIYADIGGVDRYTWFVLGALIALAAVCPFVGSMSDLFGRRYVALAGATILITGVIVMSTAKTMNIFICGSVLTGAGAAINELTAVRDVLCLSALHYPGRIALSYRLRYTVANSRTSC